MRRSPDPQRRLIVPHPVHAAIRIDPALGAPSGAERARGRGRGRQVTDTPSPVSNCPAGATFSQLRLRKRRYLGAQSVRIGEVRLDTTRSRPKMQHLKLARESKLRDD